MLKNTIVLIFISLLMISSLVGQTKPNIVFILADDLGNSDISYTNKGTSGYRYTPNIDKMCEKGIYFNNFYVHHVCSPTRAGLLTGRHYTSVGSGCETSGTLDNTIPNIAKDLQANGYATAAFGKWHNSYPNFPAEGNGVIVSSPSQTDTSNNIFENFKNTPWGEGVNAYGFDHWMGYYNGGGDYFNHFNTWHNDIDWWVDKSYAPDMYGYVTDLIGEAATQFIEDNKDQPFYCYLPMEAVHTPMHCKLSDIQELCSHFPGSWESIKDIKSPTTGRKLSEVEELKCQDGEEFDMTVIDPNGTGFQKLIYSAIIYSMDKVVGDIYDKLDEFGLRDNTIVFFCSDNGGTSRGDNAPFRGTKHQLWEGGIHVPAAIWWPGTIDNETLTAYSPGDNGYNDMVQYIDFYPTMMALAGMQPEATNLDGIDISDGIFNRTEVRAEFENPYIGLDTDWGSVIAGDWKLHYNEMINGKKVELYNLANDISETTNIQSSNPEIRDTLISIYKNWVRENNLAFSFLPIPPENITHLTPAPEGDVIEVKANQTVNINNGDANGVQVRFAKSAIKDYAGELELSTSDRVEFDIFIPSDSENDKGFFYTPGGGWTPMFDSNNGITHDSLQLSDLTWPRNTWIKKVVGVGNRAPLPIAVNYISLHTTKSGFTHFYLDNIIVRKKDGSIRDIVWDSQSDFVNLQYRYKGEIYNSYSSVSGLSGFPFSDISVKAVKEEDIYAQIERAKSLNFDGIDDKIDCSNDPSIQITGSNITIETTVKFHSFKDEPWQGNIINKEQGGEGINHGYMLRVGDNGVVNFNLGNGNWNELNSPENTVELDKWYRLAATYDGTDMKIWVNGEEVASKSVTFDIADANSNLTIGNWSLDGDRHIHATIDEIRLWNIARTKTEIYTNLDNELELPQTGLVAYYKFNQGIPAGYNLGITSLSDELGVNNGTLQNFTLDGKTSNWVSDLVTSAYKNIASTATVTASSQSFIYLMKYATDGNLNTKWISNEQKPWIQYNWNTKKTTNKIILRGLTDVTQILAGELSFSDGSSITTGELPDNAAPYTIPFDTKSIDWVKFEVTDAEGNKQGLTEFEIYEFYDETVAIEKNNDNGLPKEYRLSQNYPNPFNPVTTIEYSLPENSKIELSIYNSLGQKVSTLINENKQAGHYATKFDASNFASGIYLYKIRTKNFSQTKKMLLIK